MAIEVNDKGERGNKIIEALREAVRGDFASVTIDGRTWTRRRDVDEDGFSKVDQAYQVIGALASVAGLFDTDEVQRALDYFSEDRFDPDFLPWAPPEKADV